MKILTEQPIHLQIAKAIVNALSVQPEGVKAGELRKIGMVPGATEGQRDSVMEALRTLYIITPFGGSGRGRRYKMGPEAWFVLEMGIEGGEQDAA